MKLNRKDHKELKEMPFLCSLRSLRLNQCIPAYGLLSNTISK